MRYAVVVEKADGNYSAYVPDLPGCIATGATAKQAQERMAVAIKAHVAALEDAHLPVPAPVTVSTHANAPPTRSEIFGMRKSVAGIVAFIGIVYFLFGLAAFAFPELSDRPLTIAGVGVAIWVAGRALRHSALAHEGMHKIEQNLASAARAGAGRDNIKSVIEPAGDSDGSKSE